MENRRSNTRVWLMSLTCVLLGLSTARTVAGQEAGAALPGTKPLTLAGDPASELVAGADRFLLMQIEESATKRAKYWKRDFSSAAAYQASVEPNRKRLAHILGVRDARVPAGKRIFETRNFVEFGERIPVRQPEGNKYGVSLVSWTAFGDVSGEGLRLEPMAG